MPYDNELHLLNGKPCHQSEVKQQTTAHSLLTTFNILAKPSFSKAPGHCQQESCQPDLF